MTEWHRITGDGDSDDGLGCCAMTWNARLWLFGEVVGEFPVIAPSVYIEDPYNDTNANDIPTHRSDTLDLTVGALPDVLSVTTTTVVIDECALPIDQVGCCLVDADGVPFYVTNSVSLTGGQVTVTVDREGMATGTLTGFYFRTPCTVTYGISTEGFPQIDKVFKMGWANFQDLRGGRSFDYITRAFGQADGYTTTQNAVYDGDLSARLYANREYMRRLEVPREQSRSIGLQVSIVLGDPVSYWQLGAMAYTWDPTGDRSGERRV